MVNKVLGDRPLRKTMKLEERDGLMKSFSNIEFPSDSRLMEQDEEDKFEENSFEISDTSFPSLKID